MSAVRPLGDILHFVGEVSTGRGGRQRPPVLFVERDGLFHDLAQLVEDFSFVLAVATSVDQPGRAADEALVLLRPLDDLRVPGAVCHDFDSLIAVPTGWAAWGEARLLLGSAQVPSPGHLTGETSAPHLRGRGLHSGNPAAARAAQPVSDALGAGAGRQDPA